MKKNQIELKKILLEVNKAYKQNKNMIKSLKSKFNIKKNNLTLPILLSYDLQAGQYNKNKSKRLKNFYDQYGFQLAEIINFYSNPNSSFIEVGCGECTTMKSVLKYLNRTNKTIYGFDISWSRVFEGILHLKSHKKIKLFVADLFSIPINDNSIDIVYSSHSLEPNGGKEEEAIKELVRIARDKVILFEPIFELSNQYQKKRMIKHNYIKNLKKIIKKLNFKILKYDLLPIFSNPLNRTGVIVIEKNKSLVKKNVNNIWQCPVTHTQLKKYTDLYHNKEVGIAYPVIKKIPLLRAEHLFIASKLNKALKK